MILNLNQKFQNGLIEYYWNFISQDSVAEYHAVLQLVLILNLLQMDL